MSDLSEYLPLTELAKRIPSTHGRRIHVSTLWRWCLRGVRGQRLAHLRLGRRCMSTVAAVEAFGKALAELPPGPRSHHARGERRRNVEQVARYVADAHRTLDRYGVH